MPWFCFLPTCSGYVFQYYVERSGGSAHPCVVPNLRGKASSISTEYDISCKLIRFLHGCRLNFTAGDQWLVKTQGTEKQGYNWNKKSKKQEERANNSISNVLEHS